MKKGSIYIQILVVVLLVFLFDFLWAPKADASLLIGLLFWAAVAQGIIALSAASDLAQAKWTQEIKPYVFQYYPLLLLFPLLFLIFSRHVTVYGWMEHPDRWLNPMFFIIRNTIALFMPFLMAHFYVRSVQKESQRQGLFAVLFILFFVISQSFLAFDVVMTFEYPWVNTLFGGFFFVEALYAGIAFCALLAGFLARKSALRFLKSFNDYTLMIIGFALFWAGLFYSQYLVIWYGNIPEEVAYITKRIHIPIVEKMGIYILFALFVIPFILLVSRKVKGSFPAVAAIALLVFSGLIVERLIYIVPVAHTNLLGVVVPLVLIGVPFGVLLRSQVNAAGEK